MTRTTIADDPGDDTKMKTTTEVAVEGAETKTTSTTIGIEIEGAGTRMTTTIGIAIVADDVMKTTMTIGHDGRKWTSARLRANSVVPAWRVC